MACPQGRRRTEERIARRDRRALHPSRPPCCGMPVRGKIAPAMRSMITLGLVLMLAGCQSWDWRGVGRSLLYSACYTVDNCSASDGQLPPEE